MIVLAGDIGGTKTNLGIFNIEHNQVQSLLESTWSSADYNSLDEIIEQFLLQIDELSTEFIENLQFRNACFGVAGPVTNNFCQLTNLPWDIDGEKIKRHFNLESVSLLNDLEANAWGIAALQEDDFITLNQGDDQAQGNISIIAAGTGLGEAAMFWDGIQHLPFASEGGHTDFSAQTDKEYRLHQYLSKNIQ